MSTGSMRLRRMGVGDVLDETFQIYRRHFLTFVLAMLVIVVPITAVPALLALAALGATDVEALARQFQSPDAAPAIVIAFLAVFVPYLVIATIGYLLNTAAIIRLTSDAILGQPLEIGAAYRRSLGDVGRIFLLGLLGFFAALLIMLAFGLIAAGTSTLGGGAVAIAVLISILLGFPVACYVYLGWAVTLQALVLERLGPIAALARSWSLTAGSRWRILGIGFIISILVSILASIPVLVVQLAAGAVIATQARPGTGAEILAAAVNMAVQVIAQAVFGALSYIAMAVLYYELRVHKEAFDLEQLAGQAGDGGAPTPRP